MFFYLDLTCLFFILVIARNFRMIALSMLEGEYQIGTEESREAFMKKAKKMGVGDAAQAGKMTTLVTEWICSKNALGQERVDSMINYARDLGVILAILDNEQSGAITLRMHIEKKGRSASSASSASSANSANNPEHRLGRARIATSRGNQRTDRSPQKSGTPS